MRSPLQKAAATAAVLVLTSFAAGCGGDKDSDDDADDPKTVTVTETPTDATTAPTTEATTEAPPTDVTPMDQTGDITQEQVEAALLTPAEVSADFVLGSYTDEDNPPLCDPSGLPLDQQVPPQVSGGTQMDHSDGIAAIQEEIAIYETEELAAEAYALGTAGLACTEGSSDGTPVTISAPEDVSASVDTSGLGTTTAWEITSDSFQGALVVTLSGRILLATSYAAAPDTDLSALPSPIDVQAAAFAKALAN